MISRSVNAATVLGSVPASFLKSEERQMLLWFIKIAKTGCEEEKKYGLDTILYEVATNLEVSKIRC